MGVGAAVPVQMLLDGKIVGSLAPNSYHLLPVAPGRRVLSTGSGLENVETQQFDATAGRNYFFRVSLAMGFAMPRAHLTPVGEDEGRQAVMRLRRAEAITY
jgi:hypothetical protein